MSRMQFREGTLRCECAAEGITCVCEERLRAEREREGLGDPGVSTSEDESECTKNEVRREKMTWIEEWGQV